MLRQQDRYRVSDSQEVITICGKIRKLTFDIIVFCAKLIPKIVRNMTYTSNEDALTYGIKYRTKKGK